MSRYFNGHVGVYIKTKNRTEFEEIKSLVCPNKHKKAKGSKFCPVCGSETIATFKVLPITFDYNKLTDNNSEMIDRFVNINGYLGITDEDILIFNKFSNQFGSHNLDGDGDEIELDDIDIPAAIEQFKYSHQDSMALFEKFYESVDVHYGILTWES